jgi:hypothetical protein
MAIGLKPILRMDLGKLLRRLPLYR